MSAVAHPTFLAGFVGGALAAATYTAVVAVIWHVYRAQRRAEQEQR